MSHPPTRPPPPATPTAAPVPAPQQARRGRWSPRVEALPDLLTPTEAGLLLRQQPDTVRKRCREGTLPGAVKVGTKEWRVRKHELLGFLDAQITPNPPLDPGSSPGRPR